MSTFFSIVYASIRPASQERISIGMLLSDGSRVKFKCSNEKLAFLKKLLPQQAFKLLKHYADGLEKELKSVSSDAGKLAETGYWNYISAYSNSFITFSSPEPVASHFTEKTFKNLFEKFVFEYAEVPEVKPDTERDRLTYVSKRLYPIIKTHVNLNKSLTVNEIPMLLIPKIKVDFIGRNNRPVAGELFDFTAGSTSLTNKVGHFVSLIKSFELQDEKGKFFIIGNEPDRTLFPVQFDTWKHLKSSGLAEMVLPDDVDVVSDYMKNHDVRPFVAE